MAERGEGMAVPNQRQGQNQQNQQQKQNQGQQQHLHINWSILSHNSQENLMKMQKYIYFIQNNWMNAHSFVDGVKVQRFCLTLLGEARLWFQSLEPLHYITWPELQNLFRQRYSKLDYT